MFFLRLYKRFCLLLLCLFLGCFAQAQDQIEIKSANSLEFDRKSGIEAKRLIGNVILAQKDVQLFCDSAWIYESENKADCFGTVRIVQGTKFQATSSFLRYEGNTRHAFLEGNVVLQDNQTVLKTNRLDYNSADKIAWYTEGATIENPEGKLKSMRGIYKANEKTFYFNQKVSIVNNDLTLTADSLNYHTEKKKADFFGNGRVETPTALINTQKGWYNLQTKDMFIYQQSKVCLDKKQFIKADTIFFEQKSEKGYARCSIWAFDSVEKVLILSDKLVFDRKKGRSIASESPYVIQFSKEDSLYLSSDTILRERNPADSASQILHAWPHVKTLQSDKVISCDTLKFNEKDSLIKLITDPRMWSRDLQVTGKYMEALTGKAGLRKLFVFDDTFLVKFEDSVHTSQVKGRNAIAYFKEKEMNLMDVKGNGESMYWIQDEKKKWVGVNKLECSDMQVELKENKPLRLHFFKKPIGKMTPAKKIVAAEQKLKGYTPMVSDRDSISASFRWIKMSVSTPVMNRFSFQRPTL
jgi:lipopolysaccharide export system protein LptA